MSVTVDTLDAYKTSQIGRPRVIAGLIEQEIAKIVENEPTKVERSMAPTLEERGVIDEDVFEFIRERDYGPKVDTTKALTEQQEKAARLAKDGAMYGNEARYYRPPDPELLPPAAPAPPDAPDVPVYEPALDRYRVRRDDGERLAPAEVAAEEEAEQAYEEEAAQAVAEMAKYEDDVDAPDPRHRRIPRYEAKERKERGVDEQTMSVWSVLSEPEQRAWLETMDSAGFGNWVKKRGPAPLISRGQYEELRKTNRLPNTRLLIGSRIQDPKDPTKYTFATTAQSFPMLYVPGEGWYSSDLVDSKRKNRFAGQIDRQPIGLHEYDKAREQLLKRVQ